MYMGLGVVAMLFGFMYYLALNDSDLKTNVIDRFAFGLYTLSILGVCFSFLSSGAISTPRKFATHFEQWQAPAVFGAVSGICLILAVATFTVFFLRYMFRKNKGYKVEEEIA